MNLKALQIFSTIMEQGTLAKAAEAHFLSESAASRQLAVLEAGLGFKLFSREKRHLIPTKGGKEFYQEARRVLYGLDDLAGIAQSIKLQKKSSLRLITIPRLVRQIVSPAIARMCEAEPDVKIKVDVQPMRYLERWVAGFQFHLGLGRLPAEHPSIRVNKFCSLPATVVLPKGHRLAGRSEIELDDLANEPLVGLLNQTLLQKNIDSMYQAEEKKAVPVVEVSSSFHACSVVASGFGFTIADPLAAHSLGGDAVAIVPLKTDFQYEFAFFEPANDELSDTAKTFINHVKDVTSDYVREFNY